MHCTTALRSNVRPPRHELPLPVSPLHPHQPLDSVTNQTRQPCNPQSYTVWITPEQAYIRNESALASVSTRPGRTTQRCLQCPAAPHRISARHLLIVRRAILAHHTSSTAEHGKNGSRHLLQPCCHTSTLQIRQRMHYKRVHNAENPRCDWPHTSHALTL